MREEWRGFSGTKWLDEVNMREFIQANYTGYDGNEDFLVGPTEATNKLWGKLKELQKEERAKGGVLDMETEVVSSATAYGPGYIDESLKSLEKVVGLQTDKPLKRAFMPYGGIKNGRTSMHNLRLSTIRKTTRKYSQNIAKPTTTVCSMHIPTK